MTAAASFSPLICLEHVSKRYGAAQPVLIDVSLHIGRGEFVEFTGASGAGKSTLLRLIAGLEAPDSGVVRVAGSLPARLRGRQQALLRRSIGLIPQHLVLLEDRSILANVMLPALVAGATRRDADRRARAALERLGISAAHELPAELPAGACRRAMVARAIVNRPALIVADEPLAHLDGCQAEGVLALFEDFAAAGVTVILASQSKNVCATARLLNLVEGHLA